MALNWTSADKVAAIAFGCAGVAGTIAGGAVGAAGLLGAWQAAKAKCGLENDSHLAHVRKTVMTGCEAWALAEGMSEADLNAADHSLDKHLADCIPDLPKLAELARERDAFPYSVATHIVAQLGQKDGLFNPEAAQFSKVAHDFAWLVVERALIDAMRDEGYAARLRTAMAVETLGGLRNVQDAVQEEATRSTETDARHDGKLDVILAILERETRPAGVPESTVLTIARRVNEVVDNVGGAIIQIHAAIDELILLRDRAASGSDLGELVDEALRRIAERNARNAFDEGAAAGEDAYAELTQRQIAERSALADAMIAQSRVRVDAAALARWEEERLRIETPELTATALFTQIRKYCETGQLLAEPLAQDVAILLANRACAMARGPLEIGTAHNYLGIATKTKGEKFGGTEGSALLGRAVAAYEVALEACSREAMPTQWAIVQSNLGNTLQEQGGRSGGNEGRELFARAVDAYEAALEVHTREAMPSDWATTQNNLGNALLSQGDHSVGNERLALFARAVDAIEGALGVHTREAMPAEWATMQNNLGNALLEQGERSGGNEGLALLARAVDAYEAALEVHTREATPPQWAMTQNNLGNALLEQGERSGGNEGLALLARAVDVLEATLEVYTRKAMPAQWAITQNNLGNALQMQGERSGGNERMGLLARAVNAYEASLEVRTREAMPAQWAMTLNNLGNALQKQSQRSDGDERMELLARAVNAYKASLEVRTREAMPAQWAMTLNSLGDALQKQSQRSGGDERMELLARAVNAYEASLEVHTREAAPAQWAMIWEKIALAREIMGELTDCAVRRDHWHSAEAALLQALNVFDPESMAYQNYLINRELHRLRERLAGAE